VPAIWVCNDPRNFDPSFLGRMDYVLEIGVPPRPIRETLLKTKLAGVNVTDDWASRMAANNHLSPAVVERASRVTKAMAEGMPAANAERIFEQVLSSRLRLLDNASPNPSQPALELAFRTDFLNATADVDQLVDGLGRRGYGRVCLFGPPGTGKTGLVRYIAGKLGRPLVVRTASDLLSKWIGDTEKRIAGMFADASKNGAVLLLDEADSFLRDRSAASREWEVSKVNEMLTRMEEFQGIMFASTNLPEVLDSATLRRFDFKIKLGFLRADQARALLVEVCARLSLPAPENDLARTVSALGNLAPGDFANVLRQAGISPIRSAGDLVKRLQAESATKGRSAARRMGFVWDDACAEPAGAVNGAS
jgi:ATP-dependent 26S proteasome regulatory subunit